MGPEINPTDPAAATVLTPAKKWWQRPKVYVVAVIVLILAVVAGLLVGSLSNKSGSNGSKTSLYYERPGYDRAEIGSGIGDAMALTMKAGGGQPITYQGTTIIQACNVLTMDNVRGMGLQTKAFQLNGAFERRFFDGQGRGILPSNDYTVEMDSDDSNLCDYTLKGGSRVTVEVFQVPQVKASALNAEIKERYKAVEAVGGLHAYKRSNEANNSSDYMLTSPKAAVHVYFSQVAADKVQPVLNAVASNLNQQMQHPADPPTMTYDSPLLKHSYALACDLLKPDDVKALFGAEASPVVAQTSAESVGVLTFSGDNVSDNYIINGCRRHPVATEADIMSFTTKSVRLEAQTFMQLVGAKSYMTFTQGFHANSVAIEGLGDGAIFTPDQTADQLYVRKGRVVLRLTLGLPRKPQLTNEQKIGMMKTAIGPMIGRLKLSD